jgi:hypothetical protein
MESCWYFIFPLCGPRWMLTGWCREPSVSIAAATAQDVIHASERDIPRIFRVRALFLLCV